ncbi:hypothetical protein A3860_05245 [Niastella vici]|uniref:Uncharacterized protein n=1 Tax=Niastella vici TaxID=1703345 RepID=A0A1V9FRY7_9BACT|nr:hypothetical protein [Niastella vici]OQP61125.1 hypothetical protein A3860_05245 [Niastella vici]
MYEIVNASYQMFQAYTEMKKGNKGLLWIKKQAEQNKRAGFVINVSYMCIELKIQPAIASEKNEATLFRIASLIERSQERICYSV